ncbi:hypothetical protein SOCE26_089180 [Sorangium cellulosum]|uniref:DUF3341 domain-containing protein n=1 Tax=Sorangium cellulosum TaxID=56 RepID=A0A2L0F742_SORCE|nr:DUF3341 domain-containing protein [Sorangium cellulosum]AUX47398.1 hypothetical protein SOCE26_089180 [Sorangium cellulosum]
MQRDSDAPSEKRSEEPASTREADERNEKAPERGYHNDFTPQGHVPDDDAEYDKHDRANEAAHGGKAALAIERKIERKIEVAEQEGAGGSTTFAIMGYFTTPADIYHACEALRDAGYSRFDAHTPFPVHGLEKAMGLKPSRLPWFVLAGGITGLLSGIALAWYTQAFDYPLIISGKPSFSYQAFIPVFFELTVLFAALTCFFGLFAISRLPSFFHPTMTHPNFPRATDDAFFVSVEATDPKFDPTETRNLLQRVGAQGIREVYS